MTTDPRPLGGSVADLAARYRDNREAIDAELDADESADVARRLEEQRAARWREVCPQRFHRATLEWVAEQHGGNVLDRLVAWSSCSPRPNLVLLGPVGTGKTGAALAICRDDWLVRGLGVAFWPVVDVLDGLRPEGGLDVGDLVDVPRLILDDLGSERPTDWTAERLYAVVNGRWLAEAPTIATSNLPATRATAPSDYDGETLEEAIGARMFSRLVGDDAVVIALAGRDRRRRLRPVR